MNTVLLYVISQTLYFVHAYKTKMYIIFSLHAKMILKPGTICLINFLCLTWLILIQIYNYTEMYFADQYEYFLNWKYLLDSPKICILLKVYFYLSIIIALFISHDIFCYFKERDQ